MKPEDMLDRKKMILAMNFVANLIKNKSVLDEWYHRSIPYNTYALNFETDQIKDNNPFLEDERFKILMNEFMTCMKKARNDDGLACKYNDRKKALLAMEYIARQINDEEVFIGWLMCGVPDGDVKYGTFDEDQIDEGMLDEDSFEDVVACFLRRMVSAIKSGGLYCGDICSNLG